MTNSEYIEFMYNEENEFQCDECPENEGFDAGASGNVLPCGQYHCWVCVHCNQN